MTESFDVFVSYGHGDQPWVRALAENLERAGLHVFYDEWELGPGDVLAHRLDAGIRGSAAGILVVSPHALSRPWVAEEYVAMLTRAVAGRQRLIPVLLEDAELPLFLASRVWVDFRRAHDPATYEAKVAELVSALRVPRRRERPDADGTVVPPPGMTFRAEGPRVATLRVGRGAVSLVAADGVTEGRPAGLDWSAGQALLELDRARRRRAAASGVPTRATAAAVAAHPVDAALRRVGRMLGERFLPATVAAALAGEVDAAVRAGVPLRLGIEIVAEVVSADAARGSGEAVNSDAGVSGGDDIGDAGGSSDAGGSGNGAVGAGDAAAGLADLPWETLTIPGEQRPLVLHPRVELHRAVRVPGAVPAMGIRGPLRILAVIASPERGGGELLDYEAELARILDAVAAARDKGEAYVRILNWGSREAIRAALQQERFHVLHISCHARPGGLLLETDTGEDDLVDTVTSAEKVLVAGRGVPLVVLAGCSTALGARAKSEGGSAVGGNAGGRDQDGDAAGDAGGGNSGDGAVGEQVGVGDGDAGADESQGEDGERMLPGLARGLLAQGVPAVVAMTASVTDVYATDLTSRLYAELAGRRVVDPLAALADARRAVEAERVGLPASDRRAALVEWATPALFLRGPSLPLFDPADGFERIVEPAEPVLAEGIVVRRVGEFVGRRAELRALLRALRGDGVGVVIHGIGGVGKSTLAAQLVAVLGDGAGLVVSVRGILAVDQILAAIASRLTSWCFAHNVGDADVRHRLVDVLRSGQTPWVDRLALLAEHLLPTLPVTLLLDNAEDNLVADDGSGNDGDGPRAGHRFADDQLAAFLTAWACLPRRAKLLATSRFPLPVGEDAARRLATHHLGPLSRAEARKLIWRLPALNALTSADQDRAIADVGGHPRTLEYLDALLRGGQARFPDVAAKLEHTLRRRGVANPAAWFRTAGADLDQALAETVTLAIDDILLGDLLARLDGIPLARRLLVGACVYRLPVDRIGLAWQVSDVVEPVADPDFDAQIAEIERLLAEGQARGATAADVLTGEQIDLCNRWVAEQRRPPLAVPDGFDTAVATLLDLGLLTPTTDTDADDQAVFAVHHWTATAVLARTDADEATDAHGRAATYWQWRVAVWPQDQLAAVTQLLEAGHHQLTAGDHDSLETTTYAACLQLHTCGSWDWEEHAIRHALALLPPTSWPTAALTLQLGMIVHERGDYPAAEEYYRQALAIFEELGNRPGTAASCGQLGVIAKDRGDYPAAEEYCRQSLAIAEELGDRAGTANGYHLLGIIAERRGDYPAAEERHSQALAIAEELGSRTGMSRTYLELGIVAQERGDYPAAEDRYHRALAIAEKLRDRFGTARSYHQLGIVAQVRGDYPAAEERYRQALAVFEELGNRAGTANGYHQLGMIAQYRGDYPAAEEYCRQSLAIFEELGDRAGMSRSYHHRAVVAEARRDYPVAEDHCRQALAIFEELGDGPGTARSYQLLGVIAEARRDYPVAEDHCRHALAIFEELGDRPGTASGYHLLGAIAQARGDYPVAEDHCRHTLAIAEELGNRRDGAASYHLLGVVAEAQGDYPAAEEYYRQALAIFEELGDRAGTATSASQLGVLCTRQGRAADAVPYTLASLAVRSQIGAPEVLINLHWLGRQREMLGDTAFRAVLAYHLSPGDVARLIGLLDSAASAEAGPIVSGSPAAD